MLLLGASSKYIAIYIVSELSMQVSSFQLTGQCSYNLTKHGQLSVVCACVRMCVRLLCVWGAVSVTILIMSAPLHWGSPSNNL